MTGIRFIFLLLILGISPASGKDAVYIGVVSMVENLASVQFENNERILNQGEKIFAGQKIKTLMNSRAQLIFTDQTIINLGSNSELSIKSFIDTQKHTEFSIKIETGIVRFKSGSLPSGSYEVASPSTRIKLRGTQVDLLVSKLGATEIVLRNGGASVSRGGIEKSKALRIKTKKPAILLKDPDSFIQVAALGLIPFPPKPVSELKRQFYENQFSIQLNNENEITTIDPERIKAEIELANIGTGRRISKAEIEAKYLLRSARETSALTKFINQQLRICIKNNCRILINKRNILDRAKRRLNRRTATYLLKIDKFKLKINELVDLKQQLQKLYDEATVARNNANLARSDAKQNVNTITIDIKKAAKNFKSDKKTLSQQLTSQKKNIVKTNIKKNSAATELKELKREAKLAAKNLKNLKAQNNPDKKAIKKAEKRLNKTKDKIEHKTTLHSKLVLQVAEQQKLLNTSKITFNQEIKTLNNQHTQDKIALNDKLIIAKSKQVDLNNKYIEAKKQHETAKNNLNNDKSITQKRKAKTGLRKASKQLQVLEKNRLGITDSTISPNALAKSATQVLEKNRLGITASTFSLKSPAKAATRASKQAKAATKKANNAVKKAAKQAKASTKKANNAAKKASKQAKAATKKANKAAKKASKQAKAATKKATKAAKRAAKHAKTAARAAAKARKAAIKKAKREAAEQ